MRHTLFCIAMTTAGFVFSNFLYQAFNTMDWITAIERSYFQITLSLAIGIILYFTRPLELE